MKDYFITHRSDGNLEFTLLHIGTLTQFQNFTDYLIKQYGGKIIERKSIFYALGRHIQFGDVSLLFWWDDMDDIIIVTKNAEQEALAKKFIEETKSMTFDNPLP